MQTQNQRIKKTPNKQLHFRVVADKKTEFAEWVRLLFRGPNATSTARLRVGWLNLSVIEHLTDGNTGAFNMPILYQEEKFLESKGDIS